MSQQDLVERILALLHEAALDDAHWPAAARLINEVSETKGNVLALGAGRWQPEMELFFVRFCFGEDRREDLEQEYFRTHWRRDESVPRIAALTDSQLAHTSDLYTDREKKSSPAYHARRESGMQNGLNVRLDGPRGTHIVWNLADSVAREGWGSTHVEMISHLLPHVRQFVRVRQMLVEAGALGSSLAELLDNVRCGVIQLDQQGRIVEANDSASELLRQGDRLFDRDGSLRARRAAEDVELQRLLSRALPPIGAQAAAGSMTIRRSSTRTRLLVHINPVTERKWDRAQRVAALVLAIDPESPARIDPSVVAEALGLTPAESRLAVMVASGSSVRTIAAVTGRTEGTVRWHLKQIFRKQRISRQADLVRLVFSLHGLPGPER